VPAANRWGFSEQDPHYPASDSPIAVLLTLSACRGTILAVASRQRTPSASCQRCRRGSALASVEAARYWRLTSKKILLPYKSFPTSATAVDSLALLSFKRPIVLSIDQLAALECGLASGPLFADKQTFTLSKLTSALCQ